MATAVTERAVVVVLDSRSHPGERSYPMTLNERERRLEHVPGTECDAVLRGSRYLCWHEDPVTWAAIRMRRGLLRACRRPDDPARWNEWLRLITLAGLAACGRCRGYGVNERNGRCRYCCGRGTVAL